MEPSEIDKFREVAQALAALFVGAFLLGFVFGFLTCLVTG